MVALVATLHVQRLFVNLWKEKVSDMDIAAPRVKCDSTERRESRVFSFE